MVDTNDEKGREAYIKIIKQSIEDLILGGSIEWVYLYMNLEIPLCIMKVSYKEIKRRNLLKDLARFEERANTIKIILENEIDVTDALRVLWSKFGRDKVEQIGRFEILLRNIDINEIKEIKIREKEVDISERIIELVNRVLPEGFRIRHTIKEKDILTVIASEDPIKEEWIKKAHEIKVEK
ncbi:MAG: methanogenesis marker 17 protein [Candidatus Verstraetearchaeota archaeon]|nr:methanogenesis marker 17 protein [Candidatus Verstraetearchaeota archaeon]